jgi:eukaryotic-like serine/threonine-protein kinase
MTTQPLALTAATALPDAGTLLGGKYQLLRFVAAGGMGAVYEAQHVKLGRRVAVKILLPQRKNEGQLAARFLREARALARLRNRHVAQVLDVDETPEGLPYMVLEYLEGDDLSKLMPSAHQLPVETKLHHIREVCEALEEAHAQGIIHRDIKPANLFMAQTPEGPCLKLFDFGIAHTDEEGADKLTQGVTLGTPDFMSPEQLTGGALSPASDVWSLAVTTYEWVCDALPFEGRDVRAKTTAILTRPPIPLSQRLGTFPAALWPVLEQALQKDPAQRIQTARAFAEALGKALAGRTDVLPPRVSSRPAAAAPRRSLALPVAAGLALVVIIVGALAMSSRNDTPPAPVELPAPAPLPRVADTAPAPLVQPPMTTPPPGAVEVETPPSPPTEAPALTPTDSPKPRTPRPPSKRDSPAPAEPANPKYL